MASNAPQADPFTQLLSSMRLPESVDDMRRMLDTFAGLLNAELPEIGALHEAVPVAEGVSADVHVPRGEGPHPVLVYLHGGGWICGSPRTHRKLASRFAEAGQLVFNIDYRLAPEHPFPTPFEDCVTAVRWAAREAPRFGGDPDRLAVGGDSAGGNLSAAVASALADDPARPRAALLLYGVFDFASMAALELPKEMAVGTLAEAGRKLMELMVGSYLGPDRERHLSDPRVSPVHAAHRLPPCHVVVGSADPLLGQAERLVDALEQAGVEHEHFVDQGMPHGYAQMEFLPQARPAIERMVDFLRKHAG